MAHGIRALLLVVLSASALVAEQLPRARLHDTGAPAADPMTAAAMAARTGWRAVAGGVRAHGFAGDAVFLNGRLALVLRQRGRGAEVYARGAGGLRHRATVAPDGAVSLASVKVVQNDGGAVALDARFAAEAGGPRAVRFRLTAGAVLFEATAREATSRLVVRGRMRYLVVPDYFADDRVFAPGLLDHTAFGLPAENAVLGLIEGGGAIVLCVWRSHRQNADMVLAGDAARPRLDGCAIGCEAGQTVWVACLEGTRLWQARTVTPRDWAAALKADWRVPFPALWRASLALGNGSAESWDLAVGPRDSFVPADAPLPLIVYPLDRGRTTPLTVFCAIDILRSALGVGPCQYVLAAEGLGSEVPATPDAVTRWVEKQFRRGREARQAEAIGERLSQMVRCLERTEARIQRYAALAKRLYPLTQARPESRGALAATRGLIPILATLELSIARRPLATAGGRFRGSQPDQLLALIGKPNAREGCERLCAELRHIGAGQSRVLAQCRMAARELSQWARVTAAPHVELRESRRKIAAETQAILRGAGDSP